MAVDYCTDKGLHRALDAVTLNFDPGTTCIVGRAGAGKSTLAHAMLGLLPPSSRISGTIALPDGPVVVVPPDVRLREYCRTSVGMVFQNPQMSFVPGVSVGEQLVRAFAFRRQLRRRDATEAARAAVSRVGLVDVDRVMRATASQLSGGMCQKVMIAMSLLAAPGPLRVIIADEPVAALDTVSAAETLDLLFELRRESSALLLCIIHDVRLVRRFERVVILENGGVAEVASTDSFLASPQSDEGRRLLAASRSLGETVSSRI